MTPNILRHIVTVPVLLLIMALTRVAYLAAAATYGLSKMVNRAVLQTNQTTTLPMPSANVIMMNRARMRNGSGSKKFTNPNAAERTENGEAANDM